jgi:hypothetical protein
MPESKSEEQAPAPAKLTTEFAEMVGRVVRYKLEKRFVHEVRNKHGDIVHRSEHKHFHAVVTAIAADGTATLKVLPHRAGTKHLVRELAKRDGDGAEERTPKHIQIVTGVKRGTAAGCWSAHV